MLFRSRAVVVEEVGRRRSLGASSFPSLASVEDVSREMRSITTRVDAVQDTGKEFCVVRDFRGSKFPAVETSS